jgi:hypothetical protein
MDFFHIISSYSNKFLNYFTIAKKNKYPNIAEKLKEWSTEINKKYLSLYFTIIGIV